MRINAIAYLAITSVILVTVTIFASLNFPFSWVFYLAILGEILLIVSVYKVLHDTYTTTKTFQHFYEDHPIITDD